MANLFPDGYESEIMSAEDLVRNTAIGYRNGPAFDYENGDLRRDGTHKILDADGIESWKNWCINCILTERYKYLAYSTDFGIELDRVFAAKSHAEAESILIRQITEALLADPYERTDYIESVQIDWVDTDAVLARVKVHGISDVTIDITAYLTRKNEQQGGMVK